MLAKLNGRRTRLISYLKSELTPLHQPQASAVVGRNASNENTITQDIELIYDCEYETLENVELLWLTR